MGDLLYAGQITGIRVEQGRAPQLVDGLHGLLAIGGASLSEWRAVLVTCLLESGRFDDAAAEVDDILSRGLSLLSGNWGAPVWARHLAEAAIVLEHVDLATALHPLLEPYSGMLLVPYLGTAMLGAADRGIGQIATVLGRYDEAENRYRAALELERRFGARAQAARTLYWYARLLDGRGDPRARDLAREAHSEAAAMGMLMLEQQAAAL